MKDAKKKSKAKEYYCMTPDTNEEFDWSNAVVITKGTTTWQIFKQILKNNGLLPR